MTRRVAAVVVILGLVIATALLYEEGEGSTGSTRPNVVVILTDDQDPASVKVMDAVQ